MINNSINFTSRDIYLKKSPVKKQTEEKTKVEEQPKASEDDTDEMGYNEYYDNLFKQMEADDRRAKRNLVAGALIGASMLASPIVLANIEDDFDPQFNSVHHEFVITSEQDKFICDAADILAKGGKDPNKLEFKEFQQLIDYTPLNCMPSYSSRETAKLMATIAFNPVDMNSARSKEEVLKQVKSIQQSINKMAENYIKNPPKSSAERYYEYVVNNVTDREILDNVDFSELQLYQHDITLLKHLLGSSREKIRRNDPKAEEKKQKAIENAQRTVNNIVHKYKMKASVSGNYNADDVLSKGELASLLNMKPLEGLPPEIQYGIVAKALESYKPMDVRYATDKKQVDMTNKRVEEKRQLAQNELDKWAAKAQKDFYHLLHPNEIRTNREHDNLPLDIYQ